MKPLLQVEDGRIVPLEKVRTSAKAITRLEEFDLAKDEIARLRGPVGLYIGSKTPPEIAVAILAEMTAVRHGVSEPSWAAKKESRFDTSACEVPAVKQS